MIAARTIAATIALLAFAVAPAPAAIAGPPAPAVLEVVGGDGWRAETSFALSWREEIAAPAPAAAHYLVAGESGETVAGPQRIPLLPGRHSINVGVPPVAGIYSASVWLEDAAGAEGPSTSVKLRHDRVRPGPVAPLPASGWISRSELPYAVRLTHPPGPLPASGIRGYAVSVDRNRESSPCAEPDRCTDAETDLRGGTGADTLAVAEIPEGRSFAHAVAVSGTGMRSATPGHTELWVDRTDPVTRLSGAPAAWADRPVTIEATATDALSGMAAIGDGAPFTAIRVDDRAPVVAAGDTARTTVIASGVHTVHFYARDAAGNVDDGADANGRANADPASTLLRIDREPPTVAFTGSASPEEPELIEARVLDPLSGPDSARGEIAIRAVGSGRPFEPLRTLGAGGVLLARWPSDSYPIGEYEFRVTGYDRAGNSASSVLRANGTQMRLPNPLKARSVLVAGLGAAPGGARPRIVRRGRRPVFSGRLSATSDTSLAGRSVEVVERFDRGAPSSRRATRVDTDAGGRFTLRLGPGPSREVFAVFGGTSTATGTTTRPLRLGVRSGVRMRASSRLARVGGRPIVFRGAVASAPGELPRDGATVQLQFRAAGLPWSEFRTVRTNRRGRFRYAYRFSDDDSRGIRFLFRAFLPTQSDWPYEPGGSRPVAVRGY